MPSPCPQHLPKLLSIVTRKAGAKVALSPARPALVVTVAQGVEERNAADRAHHPPDTVAGL